MEDKFPILVYDNPMPPRWDIPEIAQRLATLENEIKNLREDVGETRKDIREISGFIEQMRGGRIVIVAIAGVVGFLGGLSHKLISLFSH